MTKTPPSPRVEDFLNAANRSLEPFGRSEEAEVRKLGAAYIRQLRKLSKAAKAGDMRQARSRLHMIFGSPGAKLAAALLAYPKCENRRNPKGPRRRPKISLPQLKTVARDVSMYHATGEPIRVMQIKKAGGGVRTIASFGRRARAAQRLALDAMRAIHGESEFECSPSAQAR
jgi:phosphoribosylamine-glycine ligase